MSALQTGFISFYHGSPRPQFVRGQRLRSQGSIAESNQSNVSPWNWHSSIGRAFAKEFGFWYILAPAVISRERERLSWSGKTAATRCRGRIRSLKSRG